MTPFFTILLFFTLLGAALVASIRQKKDPSLFPISQSQELKGLAILLIIFSHLDYIEPISQQLPFSIPIMAGLGVDLFLFLSGLGLTASALENNHSISGFYQKQLPKLFLPFWLVLGFFLALDFFIMHITYKMHFIIRAFGGFFPSADLYHDLNSPLWYFTLILFYYLLFPLVFSKKRPWISAIIIYLISLLALLQNFDSLSWVTPFYRLHTLAFPLGILAAWAINTFKAPHTVATTLQQLRPTMHYACLAMFAVFVGGISYYFMGQENLVVMQIMSLLAMVAIVGIFLLKKTEFRLLSLFGIFSYELYLLHWPIMYRYGFLYTYLPAWLATIFYLIALLGVAWVLQIASQFILRKIHVIN